MESFLDDITVFITVTDHLYHRWPFICSNRCNRNRVPFLHRISTSTCWCHIWNRNCLPFWSIPVLGGVRSLFFYEEVCTLIVFGFVMVLSVCLRFWVLNITLYLHSSFEQGSTIFSFLIHCIKDVCDCLAGVSGTSPYLWTIYQHLYTRNKRQLKAFIAHLANLCRFDSYVYFFTWCCVC